MGQTDATSIKMTLYTWEDNGTIFGWIEGNTRTYPLCLGPVVLQVTQKHNSRTQQERRELSNTK